ncbi:SDR family NAD(P)-dependent oxidoreductase [Ancylobacter mangrovi]|uniref:SDR family NAD(P)-dependent oxidoreductase n=1 Tax=Ancylobacter mangrovi TaxID=2972472 RepID=UPI002161F0D7|nr:SDR family NAD(P)-dependent oxidoreductase [Ancylobacter mangrovi]MCS0500801.1 SDR family oxidoreductase [Ancylobacter mangrovi]
MDLELTGKVAVITGGGEGIGRAAAERIAAEGGNVVIVGRRAGLVEATAEAINARGAGTVLPFACDITEEGAAERIVGAALARLGRVDILVNNAGTSLAKPFEQTTRQEWMSDFDVKVWAALDLIRAVIPQMRSLGGGRIINVTAIAGRAPRAGSLPTSTARASGIAVTKALSRDLAPDNILVNTVCIGFIKSGQHERRYHRQGLAAEGAALDALYAEDAQKRDIPLGRVGESREAGDVITFLASARASYLTGVAINIDGGTSPVV